MALRAMTLASSVMKALYNFLLYDLCDIYFEALKPVIYGEDEEAKTVSRNVLYPVWEIN